MHPRTFVAESAPDLCLSAYAEWNPISFDSLSLHGSQFCLRKPLNATQLI